MFLPVKRAPCSDVLGKLTQMIEIILEYSVGTLVQELDMDELSSLINPAFRGLLERKKIKNAVEGIFELSFIERTNICSAFCSDIEFYKHISDDDYQFCQLSEKEQKVLSKLCNHLYDAVHDGIPTGRAGGNKDKKTEFSVDMLHRQFAEVNGDNGKVCPVCIQEILFDTREGEADHYFPRKKYPALAVHPYNILPVCSTCNGPRMKHTKNPIAGEDQGPGELKKVFLPYLRFASEEVTLDVTKDAKRHIVMRPGPNADENTKKRIENMERLYHLGERWSSVLEHTYEDIAAEVRSGYEEGDTLTQRVEKLRRRLAANETCTKGRSEFVKGVYCGWLQSKSDEELVRFLLESELKV